MLRPVKKSFGSVVGKQGRRFAPQFRAFLGKRMLLNGFWLQNEDENVRVGRLTCN